MLNLNETTFAAVVAQARQDAAQHPRWLNAITRAVRELTENPYIERQADHPGLLIGSTSGSVYTANGVCQCQAFTHGHACWHRAAARLVRLHDEAQRREIARQIDTALAQTDRAARLAAAEEAAALLNECFA